MKSTIAALDRLGIFKCLSSNWSGIGVVLTLHHVAPGKPGDFSPNRVLSVSPDYLRSVIRLAREMGYEVVSLTEGCRRLREGEFDRRFVCFTLDDGYLDNHTHALPVFESEQAPFTLYVTTSMPDGSALLWWDVLEKLIQQHQMLDLPVDGGEQSFPLKTTAQKYAAFYQCYDYLRGVPQPQQSRILKSLFSAHDLDWQAITKKEALSWEDLKSMAAHPLCEIGAHTLNHPALSQLSIEEAEQEVVASREILQRRLGVAIRHFAYPYGDARSAAGREFSLLQRLDFDSSVTTRKGILFPEHSAHMQALPRVSLNGDYQQLRLSRLFLEGKPFVFSNRFRRVNVT